MGVGSVGTLAALVLVMLCRRNEKMFWLKDKREGDASMTPGGSSKTCGTGLTDQVMNGSPNIDTTPQQEEILFKLQQVSCIVLVPVCSQTAMRVKNVF